MGPTGFLPASSDPAMSRLGFADLVPVYREQAASLIGRGGPSIDHSMWFQENVRADDWVLLDLRPVKARSSRGSYHGSLRDRHGALGATIYQEHLLLPGSTTEVIEDVLRFEAEAASREGRQPRDLEALRAARAERPARR